jgi:hypothetical protein
MRLLQRLADASSAATALMVFEPGQPADALVLAVLEAGAAPAAVQPKGKAAPADAAKPVSCRVWLQHWILHKAATGITKWQART